MKIKYLVYILTMLIFTGCQDFLEPDSLSRSDTKNIFSNAEDARKATNAMYVHFSHDGFRSRLSNNMTGCTDIEHQGGSSDGARYQIWRLDASESNGDLEYVWEIAYKAIRDANIVIEGILESESINSSDVALTSQLYQYLGEAYTMRAYWYSMLIYYFGDVPFSTQAPSPEVDFNLPKVDRNVILDSVIKDMIGIESQMGWADQLTYGIEQINREYTLGMIARLALQRGGYFLTSELEMKREADYKDYYQIARDYTEKLMTLKDRELNPNFGQIFLNECTNQKPYNDDVLFEVPFANGKGDVGWNIGIEVEQGAHEYGSGNNYMAMPPTYLYSFDTLDTRLMVTCGLYYYDKDFVQQLVSSSSMNISQGKWCRAWMDIAPGASSSKGTGINWPMMRYSDVLLMFAEADNELNDGPTEEAKDALKRVRLRAFGKDTDYETEKVDDYVANHSTKDAFFDAIVDERAWEFGGEMTRKYDLIRWNLYYEKVKECVDGCKTLANNANAGTGTLPDYVYIKLDTKGDLQFYNLFRKVSTAPDETWTRESWLSGMWDDEKNDFAEWITRDWENYINPGNIGVPDGVVRYVFPIPSTGIDNSDGVLTNDGYGFN